jgi:hypothetical protein
MSDAYEWHEPLPSRGKKAIPKSAYGHFVVQMMINDSEENPGQILRSASFAEYRTKMMALAERDTVDIVEQVGPLHWYDSAQKRCDHYVDAVVHKADGRKLGLSDKPYSRVTNELGDELRQVANDGYEKGVLDQLFLVTEFSRDPVKLFNAELFRGCRDADVQADDEARAVAAEIDGHITLRELVELIGMGPRGFRALVRLIYSEELVLVANTKINHDAFVRLGGREHG